ncbi:energy transducer TonB family protein [Hydrogenophaga crocea]|uniref:Energy transducer TonB n=1 Tax=Hydrogenophaga crocea TaxID=2716225 RepID=A0A6G8ICD3_9BURK|nr:energy transducer TonB [Hydrogenophaga crocea]QIM50728.1 energy transducer TonB [Hydrogenophaga crocea]
MSEAPKRYARLVLVALLAALAIALVVWLYQLFSKPAEGPRKRAVQEIELVKPPPPPPPPKTPPPPPPPQQQEKIDVPKPAASPAPTPAPDAQPPGPTSSLPGNGSGDAFGLPPGDGRASIGPVGGGGGGDRFAWYGALVRERITEAILRDEKLRKAQDYQRVVNVWVSASGAVTRVELVGAAAQPELDEALRLALRNLAPVREGAPADMPQPIRLRVSARS